MYRDIRSPCKVTHVSKCWQWMRASWRSPFLCTWSYLREEGESFWPPYALSIDHAVVSSLSAANWDTNTVICGGATTLPLRLFRILRTGWPFSFHEASLPKPRHRARVLTRVTRRKMYQHRELTLGLLHPTPVSTSPWSGTPLVA